MSMAVSMVVSLVVVNFIMVVFIIVVFVWSSLLLRIASICIILHHMRLQLQRLSFPHQKVGLKTCDAIYYFRVKNGLH